MNYRHIFHAGNFADVLKHAVLARLLVYLNQKEKPYVVLDTHAGAGLYDLAKPDALRGGEFRGGVGRIFGAAGAPSPLKPYLDILKRLNPNGALLSYPGSPLIAAQLTRRSDRIVAVELQNHEYTALSETLKPFARATAMKQDGYDTLAGLIPPKEKRGLVLIDPPYEREDEIAALREAMRDAGRRWPTGMYAIWLPEKKDDPTRRLAGDLASFGFDKVLAMSLSTSAAASAGPLSATGLIVVNPPYTLKAEMETLGPWLATKLATGPGAGFTMQASAAL